ncbi:MAG: MFS transporter [Armatimonadota bacterium]
MLQGDLQSTPVKSKRGYSSAAVRSALWYIMIAWFFGAAFFGLTSGAPITSFLTKYLKVDDFSYGLIMAAGPAAAVFLFLGSYIVERSGRSKPIFMVFVSLHRLLWLGVAAVPLFMPHASMAVSTVVVGSFIFLATASANFGGAGWMPWMSGIIPRSVAGAFFGYRSRLGMIAMIITAIAASFAIDSLYGTPNVHLPWPGLQATLQQLGAAIQAFGERWVYALVFAIAAVLGTTDIFLFFPVPEVPRQQQDLPTMREIMVIPWRDKLFRGYIFYTALAWIAYNMMGPFVWRYCYESKELHGLGMNISLANLYLFTIPLLAMAFVAPFWGQAIDRFKPKPVLAVSSLFAAILPIIWVFMRPELIWLMPVVAVLSGLTWPGIDQVTAYMQLRGFPENRRSAYNATFLAVLGLATMAGTSLGGALATFWQHQLHWFPHLPSWVSHYHFLFATSIVLRLASFFFILSRLPLPGTAGKYEVIQAIATKVATSIPEIATQRRRRRKSPPAAEQSKDEE